MTLYDLFVGPFVEFGFMRRALAGVVALSIGGAPVGVFLMLQRMSLTGDAMAHAILPGAAVGFLLFGLQLVPMTVGGVIAGFAVALAAGAVARVTSLKEDASLAAFYLISLALGVMIVSLRGSNVDLMHVLFGTVLALDDPTLYLLATIASVSIVVIAALWRALVMDIVDPNFLRSVSGIGAPAHLIFLALVVLNLVAGFHALGTLLAVGLMMLPAIAARFWTGDVGRMCALAMVFALISGYSGLLLSYNIAQSHVPTGPAIILAAGVIYLVSLVVGPRGGLIATLAPRRHRAG